MPMPYTYRHASAEFRAFLDDVKEALALESDNMAYTAVDGVFRTFRRRLTPAQAIAFAGALPAVLRAIFIQDWPDAAVPPVPFAPMHELAAEVQALRPDHNLTPPDAIQKVARAVWRAADTRAFDHALGRLPPEARIFWDPGPVSATDLASRFA